MLSMSNRENKDYSLAFIYEIFPRLSDIYFGGLLGREILWETKIQNCRHILEENSSVQLSMTTSTKVKKFLGGRF